MIDKVRASIKSHNLIVNSDVVLACVSGGADSMAMLHILDQLNKEGVFDALFVCHVNHLLRGEDSFADEQFVKAWCNERNIKCFVSQIEVASISKKTKTSTELCARNERYSFFDSCAKEIAKDYQVKSTDEKSSEPMVKIATAHSLTDSIETVILNFARGTTIKGLCGIPPKRENIIRPLIDCTRNEIETFCTENGIQYVTDKTNFSDDYTRNKIRHKITPVLFEINSSFDKTFRSNIKSYQDDYNFLNRYAQSCYKNCLYINPCNMYPKEQNGSKESPRLVISKLQKLHSAVAKRVIVLFLQHHKIEVSSGCVNRVLQVVNGEIAAFELQKNTFIKSENDKIFIAFKENTASFLLEKKEMVIMNQPATVEIGNFTISTQIVDCEKSNEDTDIINKKSNIICKKSLFITLDYDKIKGNIIVRTRREGDRISISGRGITKTLKKLFNELKIPVIIRDKLPLICDENHIIGLFTPMGTIATTDATPCQTTTRILQINFFEK